MISEAKVKRISTNEFNTKKRNGMQIDFSLYNF